MKRLSALLFLGLACTGVTSATSTIRVSNAWSRPATGSAVVYAIFRNDGPLPDRLIGGSSPFASRVELHESSETKMPAMSGAGSMDNMPMEGGMMSMKSLSSIPVPARGETELKPGGYHLMLDLRRDLRAGETIPLRLHFARAGWITTSATVRPIR